MENFPNFTFSLKIFRFSSTKISDLFSLHCNFRENYCFYYFCKFQSDFVIFTCFLHTFCVFRFPPTLTMMHICITQCTYWTPLPHLSLTSFQSLLDPLLPSP